MSTAGAGPVPDRPMSPDVEAVVAGTVLDVRESPLPVSVVSPDAAPGQDTVRVAEVQVLRTLFGTASGTISVLFLAGRVPHQPWLALLPGDTVLLFLRSAGDDWVPVDPAAPVIATRVDLPPVPEEIDTEQIDTEEIDMRTAAALRRELDNIVLTVPPAPIQTLLIAVVNRIGLPDAADRTRGTGLADAGQRTAWATISLADGDLLALDDIAAEFAAPGPAVAAFVPVLVPVIAQIADPLAVPPLLRLLAIDSIELSRAAAEAIRASAGSSDTGALIGLLDHDNVDVRYQAVLALATANPDVEAGGPAWHRYRQDEDGYLRRWRDWWAGRPPDG